MAAANQGGGRGGNARRSSRNNNPSGRNQYSGVIWTARGNPLATAAVIGGAIAARVLLWSRRHQVSDQIGNLTDQLSDWRESIDRVAISLPTTARRRSDGTPLPVIGAAVPTAASARSPKRR